MMVVNPSNRSFTLGPQEAPKSFICFLVDLGVSKNRGVYPPKWMVYFMENPIKMDDLGGPLFLERPICLRI